MKARFSKWFMLVALLIVVLTSVFAPAALAQTSTPPTPPTLPSIDQLWTMTFLELGNLVFTAIFAFAFGYLLNAIAVALPFKLDAKFWDVVFIVVTGAVTYGWQLLAGQLQVMYPGLLGMTVGGAVLFAIQWLIGLASTRAGGLASLRAVRSTLSLGGSDWDKAKESVLFFGA